MELGPEDVSLLERCPHFVNVEFSFAKSPEISLFKNQAIKLSTVRKPPASHPKPDFVW